MLLEWQSRSMKRGNRKARFELLLPEALRAVRETGVKERLATCRWGWVTAIDRAVLREQRV